jgi:hypothetical protein
MGDTLTSAELAELLDMPAGRVSAALSRDTSWRPYLAHPDAAPGSGFVRRITYLDAVVCAALRDTARAGLSGELRGRLVDTIRRVPWGTDSVIVTTDDGVAVRYTPRWALIDVVLPLVRESRGRDRVSA